MSEPTHGYYDWQLSTLLLAYDAVEPLARDDEANLARRQQAVEEELHRMAHEILPDDYRRNPEREFPPEVVVMRRAATIVGLL
jgi:hypothetical protein